MIESFIIGAERYVAGFDSLEIVLPGLLSVADINKKADRHSGPAFLILNLKVVIKITAILSGVKTQSTAEG
jgi:hypothetical protein